MTFRKGKKGHTTPKTPATSILPLDDVCVLLSSTVKCVFCMLPFLFDFVPYLSVLYIFYTIFGCARPNYFCLLTFLNIF